jgi:hypothetical protein
MAINSEEKAAKARELLAKLQSATNLMPEEAERTNANIDRLRASLGEYEKASRPVDAAGKLTADVPGYEQKEENLEDGGFFYEPSVDSVKQRLMSDPSLSERLNLRSWTSSPDQIDRLTDQDTAYSSVADDDFKVADQQARQGKKKLTRYSKVKLTENPLDKIMGFAEKHIPAIGMAAADAINPFGEAKALNDARELDKFNEDLRSKGELPAYDGPSLLEKEQSRRSSIMDRSPEGRVIGTLAGAASPASAGSQIGNLGMKALNYAGRGALGKAAVSGATGALGSVAEGELQAAGQELSQEDPELQDYFDGIQERVTGNAIYGGALGAGGDVLAQGAKGASQRLRESPRFEDVNKLRDAGGDTHLGWGVTVPENVQQNISAVAKPGSIGRPEDIAAAKIAPKIADSVDQQAQAAYKQSGESLEKYHNSPQGLAAKRVTKPARVMLDMIREGQNVGDLGTVGDAVPKVANKLRQRLLNEVERKEVSLDEYDRLKAQYGDDIIDLDPYDADNILGASKQEQVQASVQPQVQEPVNPFNPPAMKNMSPEATADTIPAPAAEPVDARDVGTVPPKGKQKKADGKVAGKADRDVTPTKLYENSNKARNEYGEKMRPYREAMRASDMKTQNLMDEFPYVETAESRPGPSELELGKTEFPDDSPFPESVIEDISIAPEPESIPPATPVKAGNKVVLVPRARNSRQIEKIQQDIAEDLQGISKDSDWLKKVDKAFRETRDQFEANEFTPGEMTLDDGTKVTGLSALQRKHHEMLDKINEMKTDTSVNSRNAIHNKVRGFNTSGNYLSDQQMMEEAKKLGLEQQLREVAGSAVAPSLKERALLGSPKGVFQGALDAGLFRADALLRTIGNTPPNPFAAAPNTPAARIQQYLFENAAKNLLNFEGGRLGRFGNEVRDLREKDK